MGPVGAEAGCIHRQVADQRPLLGEREAAPIDVGAGVAEEQAELVAVAVMVPAEEILADLEAAEIAFDLRRQQPGAMLLGMAAKDAAPGAGERTCAEQEGLIALALVEGRERRKVELARHAGQLGVERRLGTEERDGRAGRRRTGRRRARRRGAGTGRRRRPGGPAARA